MADPRLGFIGAGRMATAMACGFIERRLAIAERILASDPAPEAARQFAEASGARTTGDNAQVAAESDCVFLAVKPQQIDSVLAALRGKLSARQLVVSIAAGVPLAVIARHLGPVGTGPRLVRVMPNTPCLIGSGASAYCLGPGATAADGELVAKLLGAVGRVFELEEKLLDAVTGLSGSGPAFAYVVIEALGDGGVRMGLPRDVSLELAAQTVLGSAEMVLSSGEHPAVLKDRVASPGGTTMAGLAALEAHGLRSALITAVEAATRRSIELGTTSWTSLEEH